MPGTTKYHNNYNDLDGGDHDDDDDDDDHDDQSSLSTLTEHGLSTSTSLSHSHTHTHPQANTIDGDSTIRTLTTLSSTATVAEQDICWDGCWLADGLNRMFLLHLTENTYDQTGHHTTNEFIRLDIDQQDQQGWEQLHAHILGPRNLQIAAGIIRRISEGTCPPKLPIRTLSEDDEKHLEEGRKAGDRALAKKKYKKAIAKYGQALRVVPRDFFVAPAEQIESVADTLCSTAEAYLGLCKYSKAGKAATASLLFVGNHETARLCRAKAAMAMKSAPYLVQAQVDLQEVLQNGDPSEEEEHEAEQELQILGPLLRNTWEDFDKENPNADWQEWVESVKAKCW